jgi:MoaA/NifB/PqqE/SkfB family radical SAM enzyme
VLTLICYTGEGAMEYKQYSPGVHKLVYHIDHIKKVLEGRPVAPIHVSVWPTIKCQFNCSYCCCKNETDTEGELDIKGFKEASGVLYKYGTKAIEFSGGGEPTLWGYFNEGVDFIHGKGMKLSLITNGVSISDLSIDTLSKFSWIRVSLQSIQHANSVAFSRIPTRVSSSYIVTDVDDLDTVEALYRFSVKNNIIVRVVTKKPCSEALNVIVRNFVAKFKDNKTLFFSDKEYGRPLGCYMAWIRAAIDWRGNFLPCPAIQLNKDNEGLIPKTFSLCHIRELEKWIVENPPRDLGYRCEFCNCGKEHNDFIYNLRNGVEDVEFV